MKWFRLSIARLMAFVVYAAIGFAAFSKVDDRYYGRLLDDTYYMVTVFLLGLASIMAALSPGRSRGWWLGFAVFGWIHLLFGWPDSGGSPQATGTYRPRFPHTTYINWVLFSYNAPDSSHFHQILANHFRSLLPRPTNPQWETYVWHNVQTTITIATALLGAVVGNLLAIRNERAALVARESGEAKRPSR
jgi:hypothetical protein